MRFNYFRDSNVISKQKKELMNLVHAVMTMLSFARDSLYLYLADRKGHL